MGYAEQNQVRCNSSTTFRSEIDSTGALSSPSSHIIEKPQMVASPIQKSAGVNVIRECRGDSGRDGLYSTSQPNSSPFQYSFFRWSCSAAARTSFRSGMKTGTKGRNSLSMVICTLAIVPLFFSLFQTATISLYRSLIMVSISLSS